MKPTLYEALGLSQTAADSEIKAALRRLVRRYYAKTRAGHTDVEEALRFLNHASHVLGDAQRRADYDSELAKGVRSESSLTTVGDLSAHEVPSPESTDPNEFGASITEIGMVHVRPQEAAVEAPHEWTAQLADLRRTRAGQLAGLLVAAFILLVVWKLALPAGNELAILRFAALGLVATGLAALVVQAIVRALSRSIWKPPQTESALTIVEGMIPRWRRDRTVFMGTGGPVEDATWLFRLRMAELKRVSAERVSDPQPLMRLFARLFDYGVWGVLLLGVLGLLQLAGPAAAEVARVLAHPLLVPILVTASWIPVEALLLAQTQTTPGRWLLCVYLHHQVSNPYAPEELRFTFESAIRRARDVWWRGCGAGVPLVSMVAVARAGEHINRSGETTWDSKRDCLVTHGPVGTLSLVSFGIGLVACALAFGSWWLEPTVSMAASVERTLTEASSRFAASRETATPVPSPAPSSRVARVDDVAIPPPATAPAPAGFTEGQKPEAKAGGDSPAPAATRRLPPVATAPPASPSSNSRQVKVPVPAASGAPAQGAPPATEQLAAAPPSSMALRDQRIARYMQQANAQQANGDFAGLARTCQRWADEDWRNPRAFYCAGLGLQGIGRHKEAIAMLNRAGALISRDDPLYLLIADSVLRSFRAEPGR